jgi:hypothetical protein
MPFSVQRKRDGIWRVLYGGEDWQAAWDKYEAEAERLARGTVRILKDGRVLRSLTMPAAKPKRSAAAGPFRRIVKWVGPSATWVLLECGHHSHAQAAHRTRCGQCGKGGRPRSLVLLSPASPSRPRSLSRP